MARQKIRDMGTCLLYVGSDYVDLGDSNLFAFTTEATISLWAQTWNKTTLQRAFIFQRAVSSAAFAIAVNENSAGTVVADGIPIGRYRNAGAACAKGTASIADGIWHLLTFTISGVNGILYIDGVSTATVSDVNTTNSFALTTDNAFIGASNSGVGYWRGSIDDVRVYTRALTPTEVSNLYHGIEPSSSGLVAKYLLDEGSGTSATDATGNGHTGTITGATYSSNVAFKPRTAL